MTDVVIVSGVLQVDDVILGLDELLFILLDSILEDRDRFLQLVNLGHVWLGSAGVVVDDGQFCNLGF